MKIILTSGHPQSGYAFVHELLTEMRLINVKCSALEGVEPCNLRKELRNHDAYDDFFGEISSLSSSNTFLQDCMFDLFINGSDNKTIGWADSKAVGLLNTWKETDSRIRFLLVYAPPNVILSDAIQDKNCLFNKVSPVLSSWIAINAELLSFYKRNSNRCILVNASTAITAPTKLFEKVSSTFKVKLPDLRSNFQGKSLSIPIVASNGKQLLSDEYQQAMTLYKELEHYAGFNASSQTDIKSNNRFRMNHATCKAQHAEREIHPYKNCSELETFRDYPVKKVGNELIDAEELQDAKRPDTVDGGEKILHRVPDINRNDITFSAMNKEQESPDQSKKLNDDEPEKTAALERQNKLLLLKLDRSKEECRRSIAQLQEVIQNEKNAVQATQRDASQFEEAGRELTKAKQQMIEVQQEANAYSTKLQKAESLLKETQAELQKVIQKEKIAVQEMQRYASQSEEASRELTKAKQQLIEVQQEVNAYSSKLQKAESVLKETQVELHSAKRCDCDQLVQENDLLLQELHHAQEELEHYHLLFRGKDAIEKRDPFEQWHASSSRAQPAC